MEICYLWHPHTSITQVLKTCSFSTQLRRATWDNSRQYVINLGRSLCHTSVQLADINANYEMLL